MPSVKRKAQEAFDKPQARPSGGRPEQIIHAPSKLHEKAEGLLKTRQQLPIWPHADEIRRKARENDVLLLVGETGSGKSTQIPQFLYTEDWCRPQNRGRHHLSTRASTKVENGGKTAQSDAPAKTSAKGPKRTIGGCIAIIQPRRVAAISLAHRVAAEIGTPVGNASPASQVGYAVRFDTNIGPSTRIKFLTDGMLLQELLRDPWLTEYSCVIVDEVHERGVNVDLVLGFLRKILDAQVGLGSSENIEDGRYGVLLKVIVMSATADMEGIKKFFSASSAPVPTIDDADAKKDDEWSGFSVDEANGASNPRARQKLTKRTAISVTSCFIKGRQYSVTLSHIPRATTNLLDAAMEKIVDIHQHTPLPGDILVFLSGQEMIENLESLCHAYAASLTEQSHQQQQALPRKSQQPKLPALQILPLFASLSTHLQSRIFVPTPHFTRRIILSTNIAETSLTVPGIRHVIDTGKHKARLFRPGLNLDTLLSTPISQSMARQRMGRAGREAPGTCHRLYTEQDFWMLEKDTKPEILSTDLSFLVLTLKAHGVDDILGFRLLTEPPRRSLESALEGLLNLDALDPDSGQITEVGRKMAMLPIRPDLARCLLEGSKYGSEIMDRVVDVVAALSLEEGLFLPLRGSSKALQNGKTASTAELMLGENGTHKANNDLKHPEDVRVSDSDDDSNPVETARRQLLSRHSDHLTLLNAIAGYGSPNTHDRREWCNTHGISHRAMGRVMDVRKQLGHMMSNKRSRLSDTLLSTSSDDNNTNNTSVLDNVLQKDRVLKCLTAGLWPNVAVLTTLAPNQAQVAREKVNPNQRAPYTTLLTNQPIHIHPSSVVFTQRDGIGSFKRTKDHDDSKKVSAGTGTMPRAIIFTDLIYTSKPYARNVSAVELSWVADIGKLS